MTTQGHIVVSLYDIRKVRCGNGANWYSAPFARAGWRKNWHPAQQGRYLEDGRYRLDVPYSDLRELLMDMLKHGDDVEVIAPRALRELVTETLKASLMHYTDALNTAPDKALGDITD